MEEQAKDFFEEYCRNFEIKQELDLMGTYSHKYFHTYRVVDKMKEITSRLKLTEKERDLAIITAYFHDLGRFEQLRLSGVYDDSKSHFDHAKESVSVLKKSGYFTKFPIDKCDEEAVYFAILNHNKLKITECDDSLSLLLAKLIRDADKLVIMWESPQHLKCLTNHVSNEIEVQFSHQQLIDWNTVKNESEQLIYYLAFLFDLNFHVSRIILEKEQICSLYYQKLKDFVSFKTIQFLNDTINQFLNSEKGLNKL